MGIVQIRRNLLKIRREMLSKVHSWVERESIFSGHEEAKSGSLTEEHVLEQFESVRGGRNWRRLDVEILMISELTGST